MIKFAKLILSSLLFLSGSFCFASDGWFKVDYGVEHGSPHDIYFYDKNNGWAACTQYIIHTSDGGQTWEKQYDTYYDVGYNFVSFCDSLHGWALNEWGESILKTTGGGENWVESWHNDTLGAPHGGFQFVDVNKGWISSFEGRILHSTNGGSHWFEQNSPTTNRLRRLFFLDSLNGWIVGYEGTILHTSNGGNNWNIQDIGSDTNILESVFFVDSLDGWVVGENGTVLHTTNGGSSWASKSINLINNTFVNSVFFITNDKGWISGNDGLIIYTSDGGNNWWDQSPYPNSNNKFYSLFFTDSLYGWIVGGGLYHTITGGQGSSYNEERINNYDITCVYYSTANRLIIDYNPNTLSLLEFTIYDVTGNEIKSSKNQYIKSGRLIEQFNTNDLVPGVYFVKIVLNKKTVLKKFIVTY